ncbi:MAG: AAA family ATPase [Dehalococcoidia bacterium]|nr:AAA family ATPase [Dehalococcoidia bacterium]
MQLKSLSISGFRSIQDVSIFFDPSLTIFVGENGTGKSMVALALQKLFQQCTRTGVFDASDHPYGLKVPLRIEADLKLSDDELAVRIVSSLVPPYAHSALDQFRVLPGRAELVMSWLSKQGSDVKVTLSWSDEPPLLTIQWGDFLFSENFVSFKKELVQQTIDNKPWESIFNYDSPQDLRAYIASQGASLWLQFNMTQRLGQFFLDTYKRIDEFRVRSSAGRAAVAEESMTGADTASALLNLKIHSDSRQRDRYEAVVDRFHHLFPRFKIVAVESPPGSNIPDVQFSETDRAPLKLGQISSGVHQILTLLVNIIGRQNFLIFVEHPEQHLHPQAIRFLQSLLAQASKDNQIIVATHDPHFIDPSAPLSLRRFWALPSEGTKVLGIDSSVSPTQKGQIQTVLRDIANREVVFARAVIVVEDQSQKEFLTAIAPTLGRDMDAHCVTIVSAGGEDGYKPFWTMLDSLGIPYVGLTDKRRWDDTKQYPPDRFFTLDAEIEDYLDQQGLKDKHQEVIKQIGKAKPRVAAALGTRLSKSEIPHIYDAVLKAAIDLATGQPASASIPKSHLPSSGKLSPER